MRLREGIYFYPAENGMDFSGEINSNSLLLAGERHLLVDPGLIGRFGELVASIRADGLDPADIGLVLLTHGHPDHAEASSSCLEELGVKVAVSIVERDFLAGPGRVFYRREFYEMEPSGARFKVVELRPPDPSLMTPVFSWPFLYEGRQMRLYDTPGHSPGGVCLHLPDEGLLAVGDNFFQGTIGAYDLPGGEFEVLERSIRLLSGLGDVELVVSGHGQPIEGREEVLANYGKLFGEVSEKKARHLAKLSGVKAGAIVAVAKASRGKSGS
jgi:glyoxylase-like metal-dependent hydrolase (beta-lactamase superfamily II)